VKIIHEGSALCWRDEEIEMDGEVVWRMIAAERGEIMPEGEFAEWRKRHGLSLTEAAKALGLSRRQVAYYDSGWKPVPRTIMLATRGWEKEAA
jgi:hypothetical protein